MAGQIDIVVTKQAQAEVDKLLVSLKSTYEEIIKVNQNAIKFNGQTAPKNPTQVNSTIKESIALTDKLTESERKLLVDTNRLISAQNKKIQQDIKEIQLADKKASSIEKERQARIKNEKAFEREQKLYQASLNIYNKTQRQLNIVQTAYNNLAAKKERYNNLSAFEEARLKTLQTLTEKYNTTLKSVDATVGKHTRNVGNYASAFNPVSNSINQLSREMPAFANSVQTGFMAISNNLPIFFDAMQQAIAQQKELQAQGQPSKNALQILARGLFTLGTALSVGVTLLTVYGKDIVDFVSKALSSGKTIQTISDQVKGLSEARIKASESASKEISELDRLYKISTDVSYSIDERRKAVNKLKELYPNYLANINDENILNGKSEKQYYALRDAIIAKYTAQAIGDKLSENSKDRLEDYMDLQQKLVNSEKAITDALNENNGYRKKFVDFDKDGRALRIKQGYEEASALRWLSATIFERNKIEKDLLEFKKNALKEDSLLIKVQQQLLNQSLGLEIAKKKETKLIEKNTKAKEDLLKVEANSKIAFERNISALEDQLATMSILNPQYGLLAFQLKLVKDAYEALYGEQKKQESVNDPKFGTLQYFEKLKSTLEEQQKTIATTNPEWESYNNLIKAVQIDIDILTGKQEKLNETFFDSKAYFQGFVDSFTSNSGFSEIFKVMDLLNQNFETTEEKAKVVGLAISEAFQQAFNTIANSSNANYEQMYRNLEQQRDVAILFAGESTTAREEIERQYEERRKRIQRQQAEAQKRLALFNIATDTAQAIIATFAKTPPPAGIPLAVAVGAIGAVQLAMVASQPIPAFEKGGIHDGGLMLVNDGKGSNYAEKVVTPDGKVHEPKGRNVVMNAPKGTQIFTHDQWQDQMNNILLGNGITPIQANNYQGLTKSDLEDVMSRNLNRDSYHFNIDENGIKKTIMRGTAQTQILNSRLRIKSKDV